jgi:peptidoglycan-associated lipoprotein
MTIHGETKMTRRKQLWMGLVLIVVFLSVAFLAGCSKKAAIRNETVASGQAPAKTVTSDKKSGESTLREKELREKAFSEQTLRDQATKENVHESAKRGSAEKEGAILKGVQIPDIYFDYNAYNLKPESQAILKEGAQAYLKNTAYTLVIEGHCDERGTAEYNLALGQKRADEAAKFLTDLGIAKERIKTISYGKERPLDRGHNETAYAKNRRDHFVLSESVK